MVGRHSRCDAESTGSDMQIAELLELIRNNENSGVEFKRDDVHPESLAKELCALANFEGGHVLLGVDHQEIARHGPLSAPLVPSVYIKFPDIFIMLTENV